eukprot:3357221-Pyramimonas_sp.AAC.4
MRVLGRRGGAGILCQWWHPALRASQSQGARKRLKGGDEGLIAALVEAPSGYIYDVYRQMSHGD